MGVARTEKLGFLIGYVEAKGWSQQNSFSLAVFFFQTGLLG